MTVSLTPAETLGAIPDVLVGDWPRLAPQTIGAIAPWQTHSTLVQPQTVAALSAVLQHAQAEHWTSVAIGSGSKITWGQPIAAPDLLISLQQLNRIVEYAVGDLTLTVEAGATLAQVQPVLRAEGQFLPLDGLARDRATLGGIVATGDTGSYRQRYGGVRDLLLGMTLVRADGAIAKAGGRVVKNVAGYDLMKLFTGSLGTLGVLAELTLRTYPLPAAEASVWVTGPEAAIAALTQTILTSTLAPVAIDLVSASVVQALEPDNRAELGLLIKFESLPASVATQRQTVEQLAAQLSLPVVPLPPEDAQQYWQQVHQLTRELDDRANESGSTAKLGVLPHAAGTVLAHLPAQVYGAIHAGSGIGHLRMSENLPVRDWGQLRRRCEQHQGYLTVLQSPPALKAQFEPWGYTGNALAFMQRLKQEFDPHNLLHPGCFVGGI